MSLIAPPATPDPQWNKGEPLWFTTSDNILFQVPPYLMLYHLAPLRRSLHRANRRDDDGHRVQFDFDNRDYETAATWRLYLRLATVGIDPPLTTDIYELRKLIMLLCAYEARLGLQLVKAHVMDSFRAGTISRTGLFFLGAAFRDPSVCQAALDADRRACLVLSPREMYFMPNSALGALADFYARADFTDVLRFGFPSAVEGFKPNWIDVAWASDSRYW